MSDTTVALEKKLLEKVNTWCFGLRRYSKKINVFIEIITQTYDQSNFIPFPVAKKFGKYCFVVFGPVSFQRYPSYSDD